MLAHSSDVLENAFAPLNDDDYDLAMKRVRELLDLDFEAESMKPNTCEVLWAVFAAFTKWIGQWINWLFVISCANQHKLQQQPVFQYVLIYPISIAPPETKPQQC